MPSDLWNLPEEAFTKTIIIKFNDLKTIFEKKIKKLKEFVGKR